MENLRSLEPQAKISHSYKKKECIRLSDLLLSMSQIIYICLSLFKAEKTQD